jgi:hypothetical protein
MKMKGFDIDGKLLEQESIDNSREIVFEPLIDTSSRDLVYNEKFDKLKKFYDLKDKNLDIINSEEFANSLGVELVNWIESSENLYIKDFFTKKYLNTAKIEKLKSISSFFKECYDLAMDIQESRLVVGGLNKNSGYNIKQVQFLLERFHNMNIKEPKEEDIDEIVEKKAAEYIKTMPEDMVVSLIVDKYKLSEKDKTRMMKDKNKTE